VRHTTIVGGGGGRKQHFRFEGSQALPASPSDRGEIHCVGTSVRTSQETHYVSATKPNRLMLFRETVAVYCENHTELVLLQLANKNGIKKIKYPVWALFVSHRKHIKSRLQSPTA
jgi:hypothetical protein